jgi:hypothetical protein
MRISLSTQTDIYKHKNFKHPETAGGKKLVVFAEHEHGGGAYMAVNGIIGDAEPVATVLSSLMYEQVFNILPQIEDMGWKIYLVDDVWYLALSTWMPTGLSPDDSTKTWIYTYPVMRDIIDWFKESCWVNEVIFVGTTKIHDNLPDFEQLSNKRIYKWDWVSMGGSRKEFFLAPPAYLTCQISKLIGIQYVNMFLTGCDSEDSVDVVGGKTLAKHLCKYLDIDFDKAEFESARDYIEGVHRRADEAIDMARDALAKAHSKSRHTESNNPMLWG